MKEKLSQLSLIHPRRPRGGYSGRRMFVVIVYCKIETITSSSRSYGKLTGFHYEHSIDPTNCLMRLRG